MSMVLAVQEELQNRSKAGAEILSDDARPGTAKPRVTLCGPGLMLIRSPLRSAPMDTSGGQPDSPRWLARLTLTNYGRNTSRCDSLAHGNVSRC